MELLQMQYFLKIAETGNMTRAAEELYISQSSLSRTISRLERDLGVKLFDRIGRQIYLNEFGQIFLNRTKQVFMQLDEAQREISDLLGKSNHKIRVGITIPGIMTFFLERYVSLQNQIQLLQFFIQRNKATEALNDGTVDYVITADNLSSDVIQWQPLVQDSIIALVPEDHPLASNEVISLSQLIGEPIVTTPNGYGIRPLIEDCFSTVGASPNIVFEETDPSLIFQIVQNGIGIGFVSQHNLVNVLKRAGCLQDPQIPGISMCIISDPCTHMHIGIASSRSRYQSKQDRVFLDILGEYCSDLSQIMHPADYSPPTEQE